MSLCSEAKWEAWGFAIEGKAHSASFLSAFQYWLRGCVFPCNGHYYFPLLYHFSSVQEKWCSILWLMHIWGYRCRNTKCLKDFKYLDQETLNHEVIMQQDYMLRYLDWEGIQEQWFIPMRVHMKDKSRHNNSSRPKLDDVEMCWAKYIYHWGTIEFGIIY